MLTLSFFRSLSLFSLLFIALLRGKPDTFTSPPSLSSTSLRRAHPTNRSLDRIQQAGPRNWGVPRILPIEGVWKVNFSFLRLVSFLVLFISLFYSHGLFLGACSFGFGFLQVAFWLLSIRLDWELVDWVLLSTWSWYFRRFLPL